ncbi:alpha/beta fold hydrolase [Nocardia sp. NPDC056100]|uniref:alpha/beta fold hydrolase n=1 Tax=Nocardia sp. NPDC056100 TaxID=3345712 RepID=UPI0035DA2C0B
MAEQRTRRRDLVVNGRRIAFTDTGSGSRTCVLVHGLGGCRRHWAATIPALARTHRVIALDLPGFGDSELPRISTIANAVTVIDALRAHCGVDRIDLVGHSMGTLVACEFATRLPHRTHRVVLAGGPITSVLALFAAPITTLRRDPRLVNFLIEAATAGLPLPTAMRSLITRTPWARKLALSPYVPHPEAISEEIFGHFLSGVGAPGTLATLRQGFGYDFSAALTLTHPTLVIGGELDRIAPARDLHRFAATTPAVRQLHILPEIGHLPMLERPAEFNRVLSEFLTREWSDVGVFADS